MFPKWGHANWRVREAHFCLYAGQKNQKKAYDNRNLRSLDDPGKPAYVGVARKLKITGNMVVITALHARTEETEGSGLRSKTKVIWQVT